MAYCPMVERLPYVLPHLNSVTLGDLHDGVLLLQQGVLHKCSKVRPSLGPNCTQKACISIILASHTP